MVAILIDTSFSTGLSNSHQKENKKQKTNRTIHKVIVICEKRGVREREGERWIYMEVWVWTAIGDLHRSSLSHHSFKNLTND